MTKIELIKSNQKMYKSYLEQIKSMTGLKKLVAENLTLEWIKGNKWMGGISDGKYQKISDKLVAMGYDEMDIMDEFDEQVANIMDGMDF